MDKLINNLRKINLKRDTLIKGIEYINAYQSNDYLKYLSFDYKTYKKNLVFVMKILRYLWLDGNLNNSH